MNWVYCYSFLYCRFILINELNMIKWSRSNWKSNWKNNSKQRGRIYSKNVKSTTISNTVTSKPKIHLTLTRRGNFKERISYRD